jgi:hypothetical protein
VGICWRGKLAEIWEKFREQVDGGTGGRVEAGKGRELRTAFTRESSRMCSAAFWR